MTTARLTKRRTSLEKHSEEVVALLLTGSTAPYIAEKYSVSREAVRKFIQRHAEKLSALEAEVAKRVEDYAIADKVERIAVNDMLRNLLLQVKDARAKGGTGIETGLVVMREKALGSGDAMTIVEEYEIDPSLVQLIDRLHTSTANELGQRPRPPEANISVNVLNAVQLVWNDGEPA